MIAGDHTVIDDKMAPLRTKALKVEAAAELHRIAGNDALTNCQIGGPDKDPAAPLARTTLARGHVIRDDCRFDANRAVPDIDSTAEFASGVARNHRVLQRDIPTLLKIAPPRRLESPPVSVKPRIETRSELAMLKIRVPRPSLIVGVGSFPLASIVSSSAPGPSIVSESFTNSSPCVSRIVAGPFA